MVGVGGGCNAFLWQMVDLNKVGRFFFVHRSFALAFVAIVYPPMHIAIATVDAVA